MRNRSKLGDITMRVELRAELLEKRGYGDELGMLLKRLDGWAPNRLGVVLFQTDCTTVRSLPRASTTLSSSAIFFGFGHGNADSPARGAAVRTVPASVSRTLRGAQGRNVEATFGEGTRGFGISRG